MSAVTAAILVGSTPRVGAGIMPRWVAMLHEGSSYAWHLLRLQMSAGEVGDSSRDDPPGVLWRASHLQDIGGELALMLHLYAARTPEIVNLTNRIRGLQRRQVDLSSLTGMERSGLENALRLARSRGRELRLAAQILPGSRLLDEDLLALPDWELEVCYSAFSRDWTHEDGGRLVIRDNADGDHPDLAQAPATEALTRVDEHAQAPRSLVVGVGEGVLATSPRSQARHEPVTVDEAADAQASAATRAVLAERIAQMNTRSRTTPAPAVTIAPAEPDSSAQVSAPTSGSGEAWLERQGDHASAGQASGRSLLDRLFLGR